MKIGLYPMVADVIHAGHLIAIEEAKKHCDYLIVGLYCCPGYKQPIQSIYERFMQLRAIKWVDEVIPYYDAQDGANMFKSLTFDVYFLGEDYINKDWDNSEIIKKLGKEIFFITRKHDFSSTDLKNRIVNRLSNKED